jgi:hypothetical protein
VNKYNIGVAILMLPFFLMAHLVTWLFQSIPSAPQWFKLNYPMNGYSFFYQHAAGLAGWCYMLAGLIILRNILRRYFGLGVVVATLIVMVFGTNLFHYGTGESVLTHAYSFFLLVLLLYLIPGWYQQPSSWRRSILLGFVTGLLLSVRTASVLLLPLMVLYDINPWHDGRSRILFLIHQYRSVIIIMLCTFAVFSLQMLVWRYSSGYWILNAYSGEPFDLTEPWLIEALVGIRRGMFFWSPVLIFALAGMFLLGRYIRVWQWAVPVVFTAYVYLIASYHNGWAGGGFGQRYFTDLYGLLALPMACFFSEIRKRKWILVVGMLTVSMIAWNLFLMKMYYTREISYYGLDYAAFYDILWVRKEYLLHIVHKLL